MTPGARLQAVIEILDSLDGKPAEQVVNDYLRQRRYIGSKDRRAVSDLTYEILRHHARLTWGLQQAGADAASGRLRLLAHLVHAGEDAHVRFDGARYAPAPLTADEEALVARLDAQRAEPQPAAIAAEVPDWIWPRFEAAFGAQAAEEAAALLEEAPVDLRVNTLLGTREAAQAALAEEDIETAPTPLSPVGLRVAGRRPLRASTAFTAGLVELQDEGSQIAALLCDVRPGLAVADVCAGAGGKTLALAAAMKGEGRLLAMDSAQARLDRGAERLKRAGVNERHHGFVERRAEKDLAAAADLAGAFDRVLVDAPCSGSGAWRRHPDARWRLTPEALETYTTLQRDLLRAAARLVKPGGRLIYVTCSLLPEENAEQAEAFLAEVADFTALPVREVWQKVLRVAYPGGDGPFLTLTPLRHGTDGFFVAVFESPKVQGEPAA